MERAYKLTQTFFGVNFRLKLKIIQVVGIVAIDESHNFNCIKF